MIIVKTTSGSFTTAKFVGEYTAAEILKAAQDTYPHASLTEVRDAKTGEKYKPEDEVPDNAVVHVMSEQPYDA